MNDLEQFHCYRGCKGDLANFAGKSKLINMYIYQNAGGVIGDVKVFGSGDFKELKDLVLVQSSATGSVQSFSNCPKLKYLDLSQTRLDPGSCSDMSRKPAQCYGR